METINEIKQQAEAVKNATQVGENTAERVGGALAGLAEISEQQDSKLSDLSSSQQFENTCLVKLDVDDEAFNSWTNVVGNLEEKHAGIPLKNGGYDNRYTSNVFSPMTYYFKDTSEATPQNRYTSFLIKADPSGLDNSEYLNARVYGVSDELIWQGKLGAGIWQLSIPRGCGVDIYANKKEATPSVVYKTGLINFNHNLANNISSLNNKTEQHDSKLSGLSKRQQFELTCLSQLYVTDADFESYTPISDGNLTESMKGLLTLGGGYDKSEGNGTTSMPRCYKFKDTSASTPENRYTSFLVKADPSGLVGNYINARVWDNEGVLFWEAKLSKGYWQISLPYGYEIEIFGNIANNGIDAPKYKTGTFNDSEKVLKSYVDSKDAALSKRQQFELTCLSQLYVTDADFESYTPISDGNLTESMKGLLTLGGGYDKSEGNGTTSMPRCYKFKDTSASTPENRYTSFLVKADPSGLVGNYINARVWDNEGVLFWEAKLSKGYWQISLPYGYEIEIFGNIANNGIDAPKYKTGTFNDSEKVTTAGGINPWAGKCFAFYGDSVTWIGQGTGTSMGHASSPYAADWGYNWQLYIAKYLGLKEFYSRGVGSAMYEYQDWVQYAHTETGYSGVRPYPFVKFDEAEEIEGFTKTHGYLAAWDRIKAQFPASIKDTIDAIFITDSNSAVNHTSDDFETPTFIKGATKDADWAADSVYNIFGGDYDITTFAGAICSMIMKLQVWMPNAQIIIGSQISGHGDESITEDPKPVTGANFTKLDEARRGMYCAEKTRKIVGMMSIPYVPVFESMSVNPLNRNGKINDIVHPLCQAGAYRVGKTIAQYLMNFTPSEPPV